MSKLGCICGHTIVDQTDHLAYKAEFIRNQDLDIIDKRIDDIASFIEAVKNGNRDNWLYSYFGSEIYKTASDNSIVFDLISRHTLNYESIIYQCEKCGRVKIQVGNTNNFLSFAPEEKNWADLFKGLSQTKNK